MSSLHKFLARFAILTLAAFALPAMALTKLYTFAMAPASVAAGPNVAITATFYNQSSGNSQINSLTVTAPAGFTITGATSTLGTVNVNATGTQASMSNMTGIPPGASGVVNLKVTVPNSPGCNQNAWATAAYTGNAFGGTAFTLQTASPYQPYTNNATGCTVGFVVQPAAASVNATITGVASNPNPTPADPVTVGVCTSACNGNNYATWYNGPVSLAITGGTPTSGGPGTLSGGAANASGGVATFAPSINTAGMNYQLTASAAGSNATSNPFNIFAGGQIGCSTSNDYDSSNGKNNFLLDPFAGTEYVGTPGWGLRRGANKNGAGCVLVDYTMGVSNGVASLLWDKTTGQQATFEYLVLWSPVTVDISGDSGTGWSQSRPQVSWGITNPNFPADYIPALACVSDPADLTTLTPAQLAALLPTIPNAPPYNNPLQYPPGTYPQYQPGQTAMMCISQQGHTSVGLDINGNIQVQYWDKVIDEADGYTHQ